MKANQIKIADVEIGQVAAEMHCHTANFGVFGGWDVAHTFEISEEIFTAMREQLPVVGEQSTRIVENKYARIVSIKEDFSTMTVESIMVIYLYDFTYYAAVLVMPKN